MQEKLSDLLIATLASARSTKRFRAILSERKFHRYQKESISTSLSRLHSKGYLGKSSVGWTITNDGKNYFVKRNLLSYFVSPFREKQTPTVIISFDIPETNRKTRNWLRNQIKIFGYKMLQQSLWIGPGPLPKKFLKRLEELNIRKNVKTFKINSIIQK